MQGFPHAKKKLKKKILMSQARGFFHRFTSVTILVHLLIQDQQTFTEALSARGPGPA